MDERLIPEWANEYVGLPWASKGRDRSGCDCWGLLRLVLDERFGLAGLPLLDEHEYRDDGDHAALARSMTGFRDLHFLPVAMGQERTGDAIMVRMRGLPFHVGVVVAPGWMLHIEEGKDACLECYLRTAWKRRIEGVYRHVRLA